MTASGYIKCLFVLIFLFPALGWSQNTTSSVYSKFGIGDLVAVGYGKGLAMGGTGFAWRDANFLNPKNPASLTAIDTLSILFETGVSGKYTYSTPFETDYEQSFWNGNLTHLMFGHRITPWLAGNFGFMPYSTIGYQIKTSELGNTENSIKISEWKGSGGISKVYYALGLKLNKNFSLGGEASFLYGPLETSRKTYFNVVEYINENFVQVLDGSSYALVNELSRYSGLNLKAGFQFSVDLDKKGSSLSLGGVFSPQSKLIGESDYEIYQYYSDLSSLDSVYSIIERPATTIQIPMMYGGGVALTLKGKYLITADYERNGWSINQTGNYKDQTIYSFGFERLPKSSLKFFDRCAFRAGFRYDDGYFRVKKQDITDMRLSLGFGMPVQKTRSMLNFTLEAGQRGTRSLGLLREQYLQMTIAFSFHDYWFIKRKFD